MTDDANTTTTPPATPPPTTPPAPPEPKVDVEAIVAKATKDATAAASSAAEAKMRKAFAALSGQEDSQEPNPVHRAFVEDPIMLLNTHKDLVKKELRDEMAKERARDTAIAKEMKKAADEWPQLTEYTDVVEGKFIQLKMDSPTVAEAELVKQASKWAADKLKLKSLTQAEQDARAQAGAIPAAGGVGSYNTTNFDNTKSAQDFIKARQAQHASYVKPK